MRVLSTLLVLSLVTGTPSAQQPDAQKRHQIEAKDFQGVLNDVFGDLLGIVSYLPFYNVAEPLGLAQPHLLRDDDGEPVLKSTPLRGHDGAVRWAGFSPDGKRVLTIGADGQARLWNLTGKELHDFARTGAQATAAAFFPDGKEVAVGWSDGRTSLFSVEQDKRTDVLEVKPEAELTGVGGAVSQIAYAKDGTLLATAGGDGTVQLWDPDCKLGGSIVSGGRLTQLVVAPDASAVLTVRADEKAVRAWDPTGKALGTIAATDAGTAAEAAFGTLDGLMAIALPIAGGTGFYHLDGSEAGSQPDKPAAFSFSRNGNRIALLDADGHELHELRGHTGAVNSVEMAPDDTRLVTASDDGTAVVWDWLVRDPTGATVKTDVPFVVIWLIVAAVAFTLYMKFVNLRLFGHAVSVTRGRYDNPEDEGEVSHFQALSSALSATVGLGNIAGVAIAIMVGGPGATVWMIVAGLLGMTLKFTECTLGQRYRKIDAEGRVSGGPMHYLRDGLTRRGLGGLGAVLSVVFMVFCIGGSLAGGNSFQVNQSLTILKERVPFFEDYGWIYGVVMAVAVGIVIIGGIKRIAQTAEKIVPAMCGLYVLASLTIIVFNLQHIPGAVSDILHDAFSGEAVYGGAIGALIMGFRRAAFSNEAGVGSAAIAHSAARTPYPVREGIVALLEPFIDTVIVCTMTALVINITGVYAMPEYSELIAGKKGAALTSEAFQTVPFLASWFPWVLMVAVVLFAFSTMISWSYYGERCWTNLFGPRSSMSYKIVFLVFVVLGSIITATNILEFGDLMILLMAFPNILGLYLLGGEVREELGGYEQKLAAGGFKIYK